MNGLFKADPGHIFDFSDRSAGDIFNSSILPTVNFLSDQADPGGLEEAARRREAQLQQDLSADAFRQQQDDDFMQSVLAQRASASAPAMFDAPSVGGGGADFSEFDIPVPSAPPETLPKSAVPAAPFGSEKLKLSNYGYASDLTPDKNSNVKRIGHANNPLENGVSAALTKSLAKRYDLKTGDFFEIQTADGGTMKRRYDDTVPDFYTNPKTKKRISLPETVDLYNQEGSNKFGGTVIGLRKL